MDDEQELLPCVAIIGGSGIGEFPLDAEPETREVKTAWGNATVQIGYLRGKKIVFLARHGSGHRLPPHRIEYRANIAALYSLNVRAIFATTAVGSLRQNLHPQDLVLLDDLIDFTRDRSGKTFFDAPGNVVHTDFSQPYSEELQTILRAAAKSLDIPIEAQGTYLCTDGPRYETPAEVRLFAQWGADVVGMTGIPETILAREAGIHYASISLVTNYGAGLSPEPLHHAEVVVAMNNALPRLCALLTEAVAQTDPSNLPLIRVLAPLPVSVTGNTG